MATRVWNPKVKPKRGMMEESQYRGELDTGRRGSERLGKRKTLNRKHNRSPQCQRRSEGIPSSCIPLAKRNSKSQTQFLCQSGVWWSINQVKWLFLGVILPVWILPKVRLW